MVKYLRAANVKDGTLDLSDVKSMNFTPVEQRIFRLRTGDVLVTEGSGSLSSVGASAVWQGEINGPVCFQNTLLRIRPRGEVMDGRFLGWWAQSAFGSGLFASLADGANIFHLSAERVRALRIDIPTIGEQRRIADFLDAETARTDHLTVVREQQIKALKERELSLISATLSGHTQPGRGRPTGWSWLPAIPEEWKIGPVYGYFSIELGKMLNPERAKGSSQKPYLRNANVHWYEISTDDMATMSFNPDEAHRYSLSAGDLLVCEGGAGVAEAAVWDGRISECYYQKSLHRVRRTSKVPTEWLMYWLRLAKHCGVFESDGNVATIPHLTGEQLRRYRIPVPSDGDSLVATLGNRIEHLKTLRGHLRFAQDALAERRQAFDHCRRHRSD